MEPTKYIALAIHGRKGAVPSGNFQRGLPPPTQTSAEICLCGRCTIAHCVVLSKYVFEYITSVFREYVDLFYFICIHLLFLTSLFFISTFSINKAIDQSSFVTFIGHNTYSDFLQYYPHKKTTYFSKERRQNYFADVTKRVTNSARHCLLPY